MHIETPEKIRRLNLMEEYVNMQTAYICRMTGKPENEVRTKIKQIMEQRYKPKRIKLLRSVSYGNVKFVEQDLWGFLKWTNDYMLTPSGSVYKPPYQAKSIISQMVVDKLAERKKIKKIQLKAEGAGDEVLAKRCWYQQATIKINCNSLPGGFGSAFNIFYDKPNYNTITSTARCMISRAYTTCEQLLGGNFAWFTIEELKNFILIQIRNMPPAEQVEQCVRKYKLKVPTKDQLFGFYEETIRQYVPTGSLDEVKHLINSLSQTEVTFLWYYCNLRHIMWGNEEVFRPYIDHVLDVSNIEVNENVTKDDAFKIDDTVTTVTTVAFAELLGNYGIVDICNDHPEYIPKLVAYSKATEKRLHVLDLLMDTFVNTGAEILETHKKPMTWRNTTIVSDTDSVIFTADAWDSWYRKGKMDVTQESYKIASLVIYWLHHAVKFALLRFSVTFGVTGEAVTRLAMKNEFLYPLMLIFDAKKTYVGIQKVKEGVILPTPKADVKGQTLRGSSICTEALDFSENLMIKDILENVMDGPISGEALIKKVQNFEQEIARSIKDQEQTYLKITSLKYERDYANPESASVIKAWEFWQQVFAEKYGDIHPPTKVKTFEVIHPSKDYYQWLEKESPDIFKKLQKYLVTKQKLPNHLIVNPVGNVIPKEMIPLVNVRAVIWHNIKPSYNTLNRLNIGVGCEKQKLLLSDVYMY